MSGLLTSLKHYAVLALCAFAALPLQAVEPVDFFEKRIRPVLADHCYKCHSASSEKLKGGLLLDTRDGMLKGGESGKPSVVPGDAEASLLIEAIRYGNDDLQMPPKERLTSQQVADFVAWINAGAIDPRTNTAIASSSSAASSHWAFQPPKPQQPPKVRDVSRTKTPIDQFILAKLEEQKLQPAPPAEKRTLLRRASYDLTGLPPSNEELDLFLRDKSPQAFASAVDRLLASPRYGERWGRHWLDVARYSDTKGYVYDREEKRFVHSHVYRDWVIQTFNDDMPYDRFLALQIAADKLTGETNKADLAAMGFLTVGRRFLGVMHDIIDDRIDVIGRATMGLSISCARCHDHKFDPIPTRDYYSLYGVFNSSHEETVSLASAPAKTEAYQEFEKGLNERVEKLNKTFHAKRAEFSDRLRGKAPEYILAVLDVAKLPTEEFYTISGPDDMNPIIVRQWDAYLYKTKREFHPVFAPWHAYRALPEKDFATRAARVKLDGEKVNPLVRDAFSSNAPTSMREVAQRYGEIFAKVDEAWRAEIKATGSTNSGRVLTDPAAEEVRQVLYGSESPATVPDGAVVDIEWFFDEDGRVQLQKLQAEIERWLLKAPGAPPHAVILTDRPQPRNTRVFVRGNPANRAEEVPRQFLEVIDGADRKPFQHGSGRLEMSGAIASRDNPLTARVMVNRIWMHHFGAGLVKTPSDFGTRCETPSHPELLDWLALRFMDDGWSVKKLHRLIMLSSVYQQSTRGSSNEKDPENKWLARMTPRRLDFESMRDSMLLATGELDPAMGGKGVDLFTKPFSARRTVYGYIDRQFVPGVLRMFDFANPDLHIPQRPDTTVPQQALFFMNSPFVVERARAVVHRDGVQKAGTPEKRVQQLYKAIFGREPTRGQARDGVEFVKSAPTEESSPAPKPIVTPWQYGWGEYDSSSQRVKNFYALLHFTGDAWQGGANWPDAELGWVQLTAEGGHAGNDLQHAAVRRWIAPRDCVVSVSGTLRHEHKEGDGIRGRVVSSGGGSLGEWTLHNNKAELKLEKVELKKGDTLDFVIDLAGGLNSDDFKWSPVIKATESEPSEWSAKKDFTGPPPPPPRPLDPWEQYAQVLFLSNEFVFVD
jgi:hypothetical protein